MKIIKPGNKIEIERRFCDRCGCVFSYTQLDIFTTTMYSKDYEINVKADYVVCPECHKKIQIMWGESR